MDPDQPADLSVKKDRRGGSDSGGSDRFRQRQQHRSNADGSPSSSSRERGRNRDRERDRDRDRDRERERDRERWHGRTPEPDPVIGGALDLASRGPQSTEEIIVLSDEDAPRVNGHVNGFCAEDDDEDKTSYDGNGNGHEEMPPLSELKELSADEVKSRERTIRRLQEALRNEEMKLVLLKKLQQSHQMKENVAVTVTSQTAKLPNSGGVGSGGGGSGSSGGGRSLVMPSSPSHLARGNYVQGKQQQSQHQGMMPPLVRPHGMHSSQQSLSMGGRSSSSNTLPANVMLQQNMNRRTPVTTPPNVVMGYPIQSQTQSGSGSTSSSPSLQQSQAADRGDGQTPAQRQAAAKLALRKQLEKTLLQIPPPKPPPPEMHFIPNPSNGEFIYLVGLETIVNNITEETARKEEPPKPFECIQCGTDFTPVWKWSNPSKGTVTCENCVTSNIKKALKAEHTNRLKTAFVKALQQEQEIEQRMSQVSCSPPAPSSQVQVANTMPASQQNQVQMPPSTSSVMTAGSGSMPSVSSSSASMQQQMQRHSESSRHGHQSHAAVAAAAAANLTAANLTAAHQHMMRLSQHQPLPAHMLTSLNPFLAQAYQYQLLGKSPVSSAELQRQYLLDMIPPRSMQQGSMNWKT